MPQTVITEGRHPESFWTPLGKQWCADRADDLVALLQEELQISRAEAVEAAIVLLAVMTRARAGAL